MEILIAMLIATVAGVLLVPVGKLLLNVNTWVDQLNPWVKRAFMGFLSFGATWLTAHAGAILPDNPLLMDSMTLTTVLTWVVSLAAHWLQARVKA